MQKGFVQQKDEKFHFQWDLSTKWAKQFFEVNNKKAIRNGKNRGCYYQLISKHPLPPQQITSITFQINKYGKDGFRINFGIITQNRKNVQCSGFRGQDQLESLGYRTYKKQPEGCIYLDGHKIQEYSSQFFINEMQQLVMEVNTKELTFKFINKKTVFQGKLGKLWQGKAIYPFIVLLDKGAEIEIK